MTTDWFILLYDFPQWDSDLLVWINEKQHSLLDPAMIFFSTYFFWGAILILILCFMAYKYRKRGTIAVFFLLMTIGLNSGLSNLLKIIVMRPRPCEALNGVVNVLEDCGSSYSFFSAHSSNSFCLALFTALFFRNRYYSMFIFFWATLIAYSRMYVGKHYPLDVVCGIAFGLLMGWLGYKTYQKYEAKKLLNG
ncbi:undecaprenyl-diphosphatase [Dysgonomonas sp. PH5-45]|uniref:phosphatase PAP2 family protein n=1 Tax=unclassified Dysgonomonas TaxID=2630389 RepID=UPI002473AE22|nr:MULTISPECIES: phosphatase PAP2 family protein [unclassified Dysgonomonas]MDH6354074.1 undecaprenyl-diphosphatase [Dysgonomonas sp. PH5-45]MDH6387075.1 undecaprenyl-diphosphatase [Dysgonomonas sp. PH5-37]